MKTRKKQPTKDDDDPLGRLSTLKSARGFLKPKKPQTPVKKLERKYQCCIICMDPFSQEQISQPQTLKETARPNECEHWFCLSCIKSWSTVGDTRCPLCKTEYTQLLIYQGNRIKRTEQVEKKMQSYEGQDLLMEFADACYICGIGEESEEDQNRMLVCDGCDWRTCHLRCLNMTEVPEGDWLCEDCVRDGPPPLLEEENENPEIGVRSQRRRIRRRRRYRVRRAPGEKKKKRRRRRRFRRRGILLGRRTRQNADESKPEEISDEYQPTLEENLSSDDNDEDLDESPQRMQTRKRIKTAAQDN